MDSKIRTLPNEHLNLMGREAEKADYMEEVLSSIRHQFGNTVNSIRIALGMLNDNFSQYDDSKKIAHLDQISQVVEKQQSIVRALKSYSIHDVKELKTFSFSDFWAMFMDVASEKLESRGIKLVQWPSPPDCSIIVNQTALNRVMANLLDNAIEAVADLPSPEIKFKVSIKKGNLYIRISDNGAGINSRALTKIFTPFYTTRKNKSGMGLTICKKLLKQMEGNISVSSDTKNGTTATIMLKTTKSGNNTITAIYPGNSGDF